MDLYRAFIPVSIGGRIVKFSKTNPKYSGTFLSTTVYKCFSYTAKHQATVTNTELARGHKVIISTFIELNTKRAS